MQLRPLRLVALAFATAACAAALVVACGSDDPATGDTLTEAGVDGRATVDGAATEETPDGASPTPRDAGSDAASKRDANGPGTRDAGCAFNFECQSALRCDCADFPCTCQPGARGTGTLGAVCDAGANGVDCESALCVEGNGNVYYCSDACEGPGDCKAPLPLCTNIALVGKICARQP